MKTSFVSRRAFLTGVSAAAVLPLVGKAATLSTVKKPKARKHRVPPSGAVLAGQWKKLADTTLAGRVPPGLARQIYRKLMGK